MKKSGLFIVFLCLCLSAILNAANGIIPGTGTETDPYLIEDLADFDYLVANYGQFDCDQYLKLTTNLDLTGKTFSNYVFPGLNGSFDGNGYTISNITIVNDVSVSSNIGFFGSVGRYGISSKVINLALDNITIDGNERISHLGGLCGTSYSGQITNCSVRGSIVGGVEIGLLVGVANSSDITNCKAVGIISGLELIGGLIGCTAGGSNVSNSYASATVSSSNYCSGGLVAYHYQNSEISDCYSSGSVTSNGEQIGGLVGYNDTNISSSYSTSAVTGSYKVGGLVGDNKQGNISQCYSSGSVVALGDVGGLVGESEGTIVNCFSTSDVTGGHLVAGLCGFYRGGIVSNCFWDTQTSGIDADSSQVGIGLPTSQMQDVNTFLAAGWDFVGETDNGTEDIWRMNGYPAFDWDTGGAVVVPDLTGLSRAQAEEAISASGLILGNITYNFDFAILGDTIISQSIPAGSTLTQGTVISIGLSFPLPGTGTESDPFVIDDMTDFESFCDVQFSDYYRAYRTHTRLDCDIDLAGIVYNHSLISYFYGSFDGNGHVIKNMQIEVGADDDYSEPVGFFFRVEEAEIDNLGLLNCSVVNNKEGYNAGILAGSSNSTTIKNCFALGNVSSLGMSVGGLVGSSFSTTIDNCYADVGVAGNNYVGGLVGYVDDSIILNSYSSGSVSGFENVGSLVGYVRSGNITSCYATGNVAGTNYIGGLCGNNSGSVISCYATGNVEAGQNAGGLCGIDNGNIKKSFAAGSVNAEKTAGGLCGSSAGTIQNCYAAGDVFAGKEVGGLVGLASDGTIFYCYSRGDVSGYNYTGGLIGYIDGVDILSCFWDTETSGLSYGCNEYDYNNLYSQLIIGKTAGQMQEKQTFVNCGWDFISNESPQAPWFMGEYPVLSDLSDIVSVAYFVGVTLEDAESLITEADLQVGDVQYSISDSIPEGHIISHKSDVLTNVLAGTQVDLVVSLGPPADLSGNGSESEPYLITSLHEFDSFVFNKDYWAESVYVKLTTDLDLDPANPGRSTYPSAVIARDTSNKVFYQGTAYSGIFNGTGHKISNLTINSSKNEDDYIGLFGKLGFSAQVNNLTIENANVISGIRAYYIGILAGENNAVISNCSTSGSVTSSYGADHIGGLCGINNNGQIDYCQSSAIVTGAINSVPVGGLVGENANGTISNSHFLGTVSGTNSVGGLCGINSDSTIENSYNLGNIVGSDYAASIGGLCGYNEWSEISGCYSNGVVTAGSNSKRIGGLCGDNNEGLIYDCYSSGNVSSGDNSAYIAGLCGENYIGTIETSYSTGQVVSGTSFNYVGGFCGKNRSEILDCFWDIDTSGCDTSDGADGKTTSVMVSLYTYSSSNWSINEAEDSKWIIINDDYPKLLWQHGVYIKGVAEIYLYPNQSGVVNIDLYSLSDDDFAWKVTDIDSCPWISSVTPQFGSFTSFGECDPVEIVLDSSGLTVGNYIYLMPIRTYSNQEQYLVISLHVVNKVDLVDFSLLANYWLNECDCQVCSDVDYSNDGSIDLNDLNIFVDQWLQDVSVDKGFEADFETGSACSYGFNFYGNTDWFAQNQVAYQEGYAAQSGVIADSQTSSIEITVNTDDCDTVSFNCKVSSEAIWDTLSFYIDGVKLDQWSGELDWQNVDYPVSSGIHTFTWTYSKDVSISEGSDVAWIDNIRIFEAK